MSQARPDDHGLVVFESNLRSLPLIHRGKVRDSYALGDDKLLIVTTDRLSAFDVVMAQPIPDKGRVLNALSNFWFKQLNHVIPNHLTGIDPESVVAVDERDQVRGRAVVAMRLKPLPIEAVVRGYLIGSGWKDYSATGAVCGIPLPAGLQMGQRLAGALFTPADKAEAGHHDENITFDTMAKKIGREHADAMREVSLELYHDAAAFAATRGIIIADTKFEFGLDQQGQLRLMDEVLTPDSSRFWPADRYQVGQSPPSFDKQYLRDWLETQDWDKTPPPPDLPPEVVAATRARYLDALAQLTRQGLESRQGRSPA